MSRRQKSPKNCRFQRVSCSFWLVFEPAARLLDSGVEPVCTSGGKTLHKFCSLFVSQPVRVGQAGQRFARGFLEQLHSSPQCSSSIYLISKRQNRLLNDQDQRCQFRGSKLYYGISGNKSFFVWKFDNFVTGSKVKNILYFDTHLYIIMVGA